MRPEKRKTDDGRGKRTEMHEERSSKREDGMWSQMYNEAGSEGRRVVGKQEGRKQARRKNRERKHK